MLDFYTEESSQSALACVIWLHGLGASASDMRGVVKALPANLVPIEHVFVDAPVRPVTLNNHMAMRAWYDLTGLSLQDRDDREGILQSEHDLDAVIDAQIAKGFQPQQIYLAGFSQGGAMALFLGLRTQKRLGGILALSAYLPLRADCSSGGHMTLPIFMAIGKTDPVVLPAWTRLSYDFVMSRGFTDVGWKEYPMEHMICMEEITDMAHWLEQHIRVASTQGEII
ncbi:MAG: alpha/beta hydrolase [Gammaproteobacteria bacterium]|nr:alpha/beta hydrolase [Gammaproteobacteria bacterium]